MALAIGTEVIDALLLGVGGRRRELQDFPVLGDVWARYADEPAWTEQDRELDKKAPGTARAHDLLINPTWERPSGEVAKLVARTGLKDDEQGPYSRKVAYLQGLVVASLTLDDLIGVAIPATKWWDEINDKWDDGPANDLKKDDSGKREPTGAELRSWIGWQLEEALAEENLGGRLVGASEARTKTKAEGKPRTRAEVEMEVEDRQAAKLGLLIGVLKAAAAKRRPGPNTPRTLAAAQKALGRKRILDEGVKAVRLIIDRHKEFANTQTTAGGRWNGLVFQISLNRDASPAGDEGTLGQSVGAIKADAARALFSIRCKGISWAVLDSGIDQQHPAFWDYEKIWKEEERAAKEGKVEDSANSGEKPQGKPHRIKATFDFRRIRAIMSVDAIDHDKLVDEIAPQSALGREEIKATLKILAEDRKEGKPVNWNKVRPLIEQDDPETPPHPHGTHVAGIIGANWLDFKRRDGPKREDPVKMSGVCPDIDLYDFRVLGSDLGDSEFAVIAALQFIRFLNDHSGYSVIHGANMSLSIPHNVRNYACGRTQVCVEAESLTANGVVVVAAAGNRGFQQYKLADNTLFESYASSSITDPGNAEGVITVGATHRQWPHTYGVSFFSSRGPTGDGRLKPDLLAPGEKITSCVPGGRSDQMDGTSMAAPHVSGAAALLMARHDELKGQPARIKEILCATATDLKRERSFQGHGMVDVLRAIQSV
ncbi:MAG TPA: S8 family serine peptidase [Allosphingosinicella sp.]